MDYDQILRGAVVTFQQSGCRIPAQVYEGCRFCQYDILSCYLASTGLRLAELALCFNGMPVCESLDAVEADIMPVVLVLPAGIAQPHNNLHNRVACCDLLPPPAWLSSIARNSFSLSIFMPNDCARASLDPGSLPATR